MSAMQAPSHPASSNRLCALAAEIRAEHSAVAAAVRQGLVHALSAGALLLEAKGQLRHGEWGRWLAEECEIPDRTARLYMRLARHRAAIEQNGNVADLGIRGALVALEPTENHRAIGTGENEWFTPAAYAKAARDVLGEIDLDPATNPVAQRTVAARRFFTKADDGLVHEWRGRVFLNPPYARPLIGQFIRKLVAEYSAGTMTEAIVLTHAYPDTVWFYELAAAATAICFTRGRIKFINQDGDECGAPAQGQAFCYLGQNAQRFATRFREVGLVLAHWPAAGEGGAR